MRVLVVDDHALIRDGLRLLLPSLADNIDLVEAASGEAALEIAARPGVIDLILLDLALPGIGGRDVLPALRAQCPTVPVVIISAFDDPDTVLRALDDGAMGFIPKRSGQAVMLNALRLVIAGGVYLPPTVVGSVRAQRGDLRLTPRQSEILALLIQGLPNKLICAKLGLSITTVKGQVTSIYKALGVKNRTQAVIEVGKRGIRF